MCGPYKDDRIIFFDGICNLCNGAVDFLIKHDDKKKFRYAPLQSGFSGDFFSHYHPDRPGTDSIVFYDGGKIYTKSAAVLKIAAYLGMPWSLAVIFYVIPRPVRDLLYDYIARNRYQWFGKRETCRLPDKDLPGPSPGPG